MTLAVVCRGTRHFLEPLVAHWADRYVIVDNAESADAVWVEWANEQVVAATRGAGRRNVVCRILGSEFYQYFWRAAGPRLYRFASENPAYLRWLPAGSVFVPEPIDCAFWCPDPAEPADDGPSLRPLEGGDIALVGSILHRKGHLALLRVLAERPGFFRRVLFAGDLAPANVDERIDAGKIRLAADDYARRHGLALRWTGTLDRAALRALYRSVAAVASASVNEACQTSLQEAAACGTPILVADWMGAAGIYEPAAVWGTASGFWRAVDGGAQHPRRWALTHWAYPVVFPVLDGLLEEAARCGESR